MRLRVSMGGNAAPLPIEEDELRRALGGESGPCVNVRGERHAREAPAGAAAADRDDPGERGVLEVVRGGVAPGAKAQRVVHGRRRLGDLGRRRAPRPMATTTRS